MCSCCGARDTQAGDKLPQDVYEAVLAELPSLSGKTVAVTGCTTGLGYYLALLAARKGASKLLLLNRPSARAKAAHEDVAKVAGLGTQVVTVDTDLQSLASVREAAARVQAESAAAGLHVLANNAGVMAQDDTRTADGFEVQMQTNQLSHVLLTKLLWPQLELAASKGEARVVFHSSSARDISGQDLDAKYFQRCEPGTLGGDHGWIGMQVAGLCEGPWIRYHQSKLANSAYAMALHSELQARGSKVKAMAVDPGASTTELSNSSAHSVPEWMVRLLGISRQSAADGCTPLAVACFGPADSGDFYMPEGGFTGPPKKTISRGGAVKEGDEKLTTSKKNQDLAWEQSHAALGMETFF
eukprot:CAMPEP_0179092360 /NCGR_PEP_ID=MMETSP0796-20121207/42238_1 /TAXON_ID=73915 /ORGANISM="Pyrodinium bahamense, Strain pbaha01" /LENGTH=355 /DNA_ID=CAMNT_0020789965 /DNA_START=35 /DNA_END=1102 /DNA_ORIENTATION=+